MTATNHALTGAVIGLASGQPLLAVPAAVASHFVCDALPHFGWPDNENEGHLESNGFRDYLIVEAAVCFFIVLALAIFQPVNWLLAAVCAFAAASPDLLWINRYRAAKAGRSWRGNAFLKWAHDIQWFQRPIGAVVEVVWFVAMLFIIWQLVV